MIKVRIPRTWDKKSVFCSSKIKKMLQLWFAFKLTFRNHWLANNCFLLVVISYYINKMKIFNFKNIFCHILNSYIQFWPWQSLNNCSISNNVMIIGDLEIFKAGTVEMNRPQFTFVYIFILGPLHNVPRFIFQRKKNHLLFLRQERFECHLSWCISLT